MSRTVYGATLSPFVRKTVVALIEKGLDYDLKFVDPNNKPANFEELSPLGKIPVLTEDDLCLSDSAVITQYLEEANPNTTPIYPASPEASAKARWFEKYADYELAPLTTFGIFRNRIIRPITGKDCDEQHVQTALETLQPMFSFLESKITNGENYLINDTFSIADIALGAQFGNFLYGGEHIDSNRWPKLAAYINFVHTRDSFVQTMQRDYKTIDKIKAMLAK